MARNAEKAGFNPLTAIRNGGSAGFTTTVSHPALSSGAFIADAIGGIGRAISSYDPMAEATAKLETQIRQATLENLQADTAARLRASVGGVPVSTGGTVKPKPIPDLFVPYRDNSVEGAGRIIYLPNSDIPELDQMAVPPFGTVANDLARGGRAVGIGGPPVSTGPGGSSNPPRVLPPLAMPFDPFGDAVNWWNSKADADYARHKARF